MTLINLIIVILKSDSVVVPLVVAEDQKIGWNVGRKTKPVMRSSACKGR